MGQTDSHFAQDEGNADGGLATLTAAFLDGRAEGKEPSHGDGPAIERLEDGKWVPAAWLPTGFWPRDRGKGHSALEILQREEHGLWSDLGPAESSQLLSGGSDRVVYRRGLVPYEVDMKKLTWRSGCRKGRLRLKPQAVAGLSQWLRREPPEAPQEEAAALAAWCSDRLAWRGQGCDGALLQYHQQRRAFAGSLAGGSKAAEDAEGTAQRDASLAGCAYAGALGRLALEPALAGPGAELALQILEAQLSSVPALAVRPLSGTEPSPAFTTALGFSEAFRCSLCAEKALPPAVARRVCGLLLRVGLQAGLSGPVLAAATWLLRSKERAAAAEEELKPLVAAIHYVNGPREIEVLRSGQQQAPSQQMGMFCSARWEKLPRREGAADWPRGPAVLHSAVNFPGAAGAAAAAPGVRFAVRLAGEAESAWVGLCKLDSVIMSPTVFENVPGLVMVGKQHALCHAEDTSSPQSDFGPRAFQDGDEVTLTLRETEIRVEVNGEQWGALAVPPVFWSAGARVVVALQSSKALAEIDLSPDSREEASEASATWAAAAGQADFEATWRQAAQAPEGRAAAVLLQCLGRNAQRSAEVGTSPPTAATLVEESEHNYAPNMNEWKRVEVPGALRLKVEFDRSCQTERGRDVLTFYKDRNTRMESVEPMSGDPENFKGFEVDGSGFWYNFVTDGSDERWGYKFTVTPTRILDARSDVPLAAEGIGSGVTESLEALLKLVSEQHPLGETSLKGIFKATGAELRYLAHQGTGGKGADKAAMRSLLRALLKAAEAKFPALQPGDLVERLAVEALKVAGPRVAGDSLSRTELIVMVLENSSCPPTLASEINRLLAGEEHYGQLLGDLAAARSLLERLAAVALEGGSVPAANRAQAARMLVQVLGDILSALAGAEAHGRSEQWALVRHFAGRILEGSEAVVAAAKEDLEPHRELLGLLTPALLRGLALALPTTPWDFIQPLLPKLQSLVAAAKSQAAASSAPLHSMHRELIAGCLALQHAFSLGLLQSGDPHKGAVEGHVAEALRCQLLRSVPQSLLAEAAEGDDAQLAQVDKLAAEVDELLQLPQLPRSATPRPHKVLDEFVAAEAPGPQALAARLDAAAAGPMHLPQRVQKVKRLAFAILVRHYDLEEELDRLVALSADASSTPTKAAPRAMSLLWKQAHWLAQQVMSFGMQVSADGDAQAGAAEAEAHLHFALHCAPSQHKKFDVDLEEAAAAAQEEAQAALEVRQRMTRGSSDFADLPDRPPALTRVVSEVSDANMPAMPPSLSRWLSAPASAASDDLRTPAHWAKLKVRLSSVRTLQLSLKPLRAIMAAEGSRALETRPVDQLKRFLQVPLSVFLERVRAQTQAARCIAVSLRLLSAGVQAACRVSAAAAAEALLALRTAWQLSVEAAQQSAEASALAALHAAQEQAVGSVVAAARDLKQWPSLKPPERAQLQALALSCLCGRLGPHELQAMEQQVGPLLAEAAPWARGAPQAGAPRLPSRCAAWLCDRARVAAACGLPPEERAAVLGRIAGALVAARPSLASKPDTPRQAEPLSLLAVFAPIGGISSQGNETTAWGWQRGVVPGAPYAVEGDRDCLLRSTGPELSSEAREEIIPNHVQQLVTCRAQFSSGKHYWEVSVEDAPSDNFSINVVGVAGPDPPKEFKACQIGSSWGVMALEQGAKVRGAGGGDGSEVNPEESEDPDEADVEDYPFPPFEKGLVIGVLLDCDAGSLTFFANGECKGTAFEDLQGEGPFSPFISVGGGGFAFKLNLSPSTLPPEAQGAEVVSAAEPRPSTPSAAPRADQLSLGGLGLCAEHPTVAWLLSLGWVVAALAGTPSATPRAELVGALLPILLADEAAEPLTKVLAGVLLEGLAPPVDTAEASQLLASMAGSGPGWVRAAKARVLRQWCALGPKDASSVWVALTQALGAEGELRQAALEVVAETASLCCLANVRIDSPGGSGVGSVVQVYPSQVAVLPAESNTVVWHDVASLWIEPKRCRPPFPQEFVNALVSSAQAKFKGREAAPSENVRELFAVLSVLEDPKVAQASIGLVRDLAPLALAETPDPALGSAWNAVPATRRVDLCMALLARTPATEALAAAVRSSGKAAKETFLAAAGAHSLVPAGKAADGAADADQEAPPRAWKLPASPSERLLTQPQFAELVLGLLEGVSSAEAEELWSLAFAGKELQAVPGSGPAWRASAPAGGESSAWTQLEDTVALRLDEALQGSCESCTFTATLPPSEEAEEFKFSLPDMTIQPSAGGPVRQVTRSGTAEPAIDLAEFESLLSEGSRAKARRAGSGEAPADKEPSPGGTPRSTDFTKVLEVLGLGEAEQPRSRESLLRLLCAAPVERGGLLRCLLPLRDKKERSATSAEGDPENEEDEAANKGLDQLRRRSTAPAAAAHSVAKWTEGHLARLACAKVASGCKALEAQSFGQAAEVVQMLLAIRPLADLRELEGHLGPALAQDQGLAAAFQQAASAEFLGILRDCLRPSEPALVEECKHPYENNMDVWKEVRIPGAQNLRVRFDPRSSTEANCDVLRFTSERGGSRLPGTSEGMSGPSGSFAGFQSEGEAFWYNFKTDGSNVDWGFKFTVTAQPPVLPETSYWDSGSSTPNMEDALWLLKVALTGAASSSGGTTLSDLRTDVVVPVLLALVDRLPGEEERIQALGALGDLFGATGGKPSQLWSELHSRLLLIAGDRAASWATPAGQAITALLVRLAPSLPKELLGLRFTAPAPPGGALVDLVGAQALFVEADTVCALEDGVVSSGEAASVRLLLSKGVRVGVVPAVEGPVDVSKMVAVEVKSGSSSGGKNRWSEESSGVERGAAALSGEDSEVLTSNKMEGTNYLVRAKDAYRSGVHYWEIRCLNRNGGGNGYHMIGVATEDAKDVFPGFDCGDKIWGLWLDDDYKVHNGQKTSLGCRIDHSTGAVYGVLLDCDAGELSFYSHGSNVGGVAFDSLSGGPYYPMICVGCLESNTYQVDFSPQEVPEDVVDRLTSGGGGNGTHTVTCDLRGGAGAGRLTVALPHAGLVTRALPDGVGAWRFVVAGATGSEAALSCDPEPEMDVALATAQVAMEAVAKGCQDGALPEFATEAFVAWHDLEKLPDAEEAAEKPKEPVYQPPWASLGPDQLVVFGAGCPEVNGVYSKIAEEPETYMSAEEATLVNDRDRHWVICTTFNVELWAYEAPAKEGPWTSGPRGQLPPPTVCGPAGPAVQAAAANPEARSVSSCDASSGEQWEFRLEGERLARYSNGERSIRDVLTFTIDSGQARWTGVSEGGSAVEGSAPTSEVYDRVMALFAQKGQKKSELARGLPALLRELRSASATVSGTSEELLQLPGAERLALALESGKAVELVKKAEGREDRSATLRPGHVVEVEGEACALRALAASSPQGWAGEPQNEASAQGLFQTVAGDHCFSVRGHMSVGPMQFIGDKVPGAQWTQLASELPACSVLCRSGHVMKARARSYGWHCDKCGNRGEQILRFRCDEDCNWDYCGPCQLELATGLMVETKSSEPRGVPAVGERVLAEFLYRLDSRGMPERKPAVVTEVNGDGSLQVTWDDGDPRDRRKLASQVRPESFESKPEIIVKGVAKDSSAAKWNASHPEQAIQRGYRVVSAQGAEGDSDAIMSAMCTANEQTLLKLSVCKGESREQRAAPTAAVSWKDVFRQWAHEAATFATSPEIRVHDADGELRIGLCSEGKNANLLQVAALKAARGDVLRILLAIRSGAVLAAKLLRNGRLAAFWLSEAAGVADGSKPAELMAPDAGQLRVWVACASAEGPPGQCRAAVQLLPFAATGPQAKPSAEVAEPECPSDLGGVPGDAWEEFKAWWPEAESATVVAWPVGRSDQQQVLASLSEKVASFCTAVLGGWKLEADEELVHSIEAVAKETGRKLLAGPRLDFDPKSAKHWVVEGHTAREGYGRYLVLCTLNALIAKNVLPVVDLGKLLASPHGRALHALKRLLFSELRGTAVQPNGPMGAQVKLQLKRPLATACREAGQCDTDGQQMLFAQASSQCRDPSTFRRSGQNWQEQPFSVAYEDEAGVDQGGLYRDFLDAVTEELMSPQLPVLLPTANQSTNTGEHRDTWVLNPALEAGPGSPGERLLLFLGRLMGLCLLRGDIIPLTLPSTFWKGLQGEDVGLTDLEAIDVAAANSVRMLREPSKLGVDADSFGDTFPDLRYVIEDSAHQRRELTRGGADRPVTFEDAPLYANYMMEQRLRESEQQLTVLRRGLREVAKMSSWALWPWQSLEERVVGVSHIDLGLLRQKTIYDGGYDESSPAVARFWAALESFSQEQLRSFLHFVWGRSRLPPAASDKWGPGFKLSKAGRTDMLPLAHTCFFQLELPEYETEEVMRERVLFAVQNCVSMAIA